MQTAKMRRLWVCNLGGWVRLADMLLPGLLLLLLQQVYGRTVGQLESYVALALASAFTVAFVFNGSGLYRQWSSAPLYDHAQRLLIAWSMAATVLLILGYAAKLSADYSRVVIFSWLLACPVLLIGVHFGAVAQLQRWRRRGESLVAAAVVGSNEAARRLVSLFRADPGLGILPVGYFDSLEAAAAAGEDWLGRLEEVAEVVRTKGIKRVYIALAMSEEARIVGLLQRLHDLPCRVYLVPDLTVFGLLNARMEVQLGVPLLALGDVATDEAETLVKRCVDVGLGAGLLALCAPLMLLVAAGVRLSSSGPVLFKQRRFGVDGLPIRIYKFRTMTVLEDQDQAAAGGYTTQQVRREDERVTALGRLLRRSSLDELPQLINVLQGRISLVGPRPHPVAANEFYRRLIPEYMLRHKVKPGMTGWAQVHGLRGETATLDKMQRRIDFDLYYIHNSCLLLDLHILFKTVRAVVWPSNAY